MMCGFQVNGPKPRAAQGIRSIIWGQVRFENRLSPFALEMSSILRNRAEDTWARQTFLQPRVSWILECFRQRLVTLGNLNHYPLC